jgi:hypothetical protein
VAAPGSTNTAFPLTPALSLREREQSVLRLERFGALDPSISGNRFSLSLRERLGVRGNAASKHPESQPMRSTRSSPSLIQA